MSSKTVCSSTFKVRDTRLKQHECSSIHTNIIIPSNFRNFKTAYSFVGKSNRIRDMMYQKYQEAPILVQIVALGKNRCTISLSIHFVYKSTL